jgi:hypothetical protein
MQKDEVAHNQPEQFQSGLLGLIEWRMQEESKVVKLLAKWRTRTLAVAAIGMASFIANPPPESVNTLFDTLGITLAVIALLQMPRKEKKAQDRMLAIQDQKMEIVNFVADWDEKLALLVRECGADNVLAQVEQYILNNSKNRQDSSQEVE